jgi:hypothetical protein
MGKKVLKFAPKAGPVPKKMLRAVRAKHGRALISRDCSTLKPGEICKEYKCVDGYRLVFRCNKTGGCTEAEYVKCDD